MLVRLIKTNDLGDTIWTKTIGGNDLDEGHSIQKTIDGGFIIVGYTRSYGVGERDALLIKTNSLGDVLWIKTFGGIHYDYGNSVYQTAD